MTIITLTLGGKLTYTVNGAQVVKQITRQVIGFYNLTGSYFGGLKREGNGCVSAALNGSSLNQAIYSVNHDVATGSLTITEIGGTLCNFSGSTTVFGSLIEGSGNVASNGCRRSLVKLWRCDALLPHRRWDGYDSLLL